MYFSQELKQTDIWMTILKKYQNERERFRKNPRSPEYKRDIETIEHIEKLILEKSKLYKSKTESKYSSIFRTSNFTIDFGNTTEN